LGWESFEEGFSKGTVQELLKGKAPLLNRILFWFLVILARASIGFFLLFFQKTNKFLFWRARQALLLSHPRKMP